MPHSWTSALFKKFQARYGAKWVASIDGIEKLAVDEWSNVLAGMKGEDIARGLESWTEEWPPSAHEFKRACKQYATAAHRPFDKSKALEKLPDPEVGKTALSTMCKSLGIKGRNSSE